MNENKTIGTLADVLSLIDQTGLTGTRRRDMISAINRICEMAGTTPASVCAEPPVLKEMLSRIRPAAHGVSAKSYSNLRSLLAAALELAGVIDPSGRGRAIRHPQWGPLLQAVADDQRLSNGLAAFANWCAGQDISPEAVDDSAVQQFLTWLEAKTLHPKPRDLVRRIPNVWNEASTKFDFWPTTKLTTLSFKTPPKHLNWSELSPSFQQDGGRLSRASFQARSLRRAARGAQTPPCRHHAPSTARTSAPGCFHLGSGWGRNCLAGQPGQAGELQEGSSLLPQPSQWRAQRLRHRRRQDIDPSCAIPHRRNIEGSWRAQAYSRQPAGGALRPH